MQKIVGFSDFNAMVNFLHKVIKHGEVEIHGEHHSTHEIVMDWTITVSQWPIFRIKWSVPSTDHQLVWLVFQVQHRVMSSIKVPLYLRTHVLLEPPATKGGSEKVFKMFDEWGGNPLMTELNTVPAWLGRTHSKLRLFHGFLMTKIFDLFK